MNNAGAIPAGHRKCADAVVAMDRVLTPTRWTTPRSAAAMRTAVVEHVIDGKSRFSETLSYPTVEIHPSLAAIDAAEQLVGEVEPAGLAHAVSEHLARQRKRTLMIASRDDEVFRHAIADLDGLPDATLVETAQAVLAGESGSTDADAAEISAHEAASTMRSFLARRGLTAWIVELHADMAARMSVNGAQRVVKVRADARFTQAAVARLCVHEIDGHVERWERATRQPEPFAPVQLGRALPTEEGLALWGEQRAGLTDPQLLRTYAARVVAVDVARDGGILDVARALMDLGISTREAAEIALRVKRGLVDVNAPGGATKDWSYLGGLALIGEVEAADPANLELLRCVKWSTDHLDLLKDLSRQGRLIPR